MDKKYICYCGLYCESCAVMAKVRPASRVLYDEMKKAGFEEVINLIPGGEGFWPFLKGMAENGMCISCKDGGGNPECAIRKCAKEKKAEMCALCESYPCEVITNFFDKYPLLKQDNDLIRKEGIEAWGKIQDERLTKGFTFADLKNPADGK